MVIFFCFPCSLYRCAQQGLLSNISVLILTLTYLSLLIPNIIHDINNSQCFTLLTYLFISFFTYILTEALKINTVKAYLEALLVLVLLLPFASFYYATPIYICITLGEAYCNYEFNQNFEVVVISASFLLILFVIQKFFSCVFTKDKTK